MDAIDRVKRARGIDDLAETIEPLAQAMASLSEETRETLTEFLSESMKQSEKFSDKQTKALSTWNKGAEEMRGAAEDLVRASERAESAAKWWQWSLFGWALMASVLPMLLLVTASWIWLGPKVVKNERGTWLLVRLGD